jgi:hypothetical protein
LALGQSPDRPIVARGIAGDAGSAVPIRLVSNVERGKRIIELAHAGGRDPDTLCDEALKTFRFRQYRPARSAGS